VPARRLVFTVGVGVAVLLRQPSAADIPLAYEGRWSVRQ
jgi:hypothetical protein